MVRTGVAVTGGGVVIDILLLQLIGIKILHEVWPQPGEESLHVSLDTILYNGGQQPCQLLRTPHLQIKNICILSYISAFLDVHTAVILAIAMKTLRSDSFYYLRFGEML